MGLSQPRQRLFHVKHQPTGPASQSISAVRRRPEESDRSDCRVLPHIPVAHAINASSPKGEPPRRTGDTSFARRRQCHAARPAMGTNPREQARGRRFLAHRENHALVDVSRETLGYSPGRAGICGCENLRRIPAATRGHVNAPTAHRIDAHETIRGVIYASPA